MRIEFSRQTLLLKFHVKTFGRWQVHLFDATGALWKCSECMPYIHSYTFTNYSQYSMARALCQIQYTRKMSIYTLA
jgi:hypothetical protein